MKRFGVAYLERLLFLFFFLIITGCAVQGGAAKRSFSPKGLNPPPIQHCFDQLGHQQGAKPFVLGGTCVCSPTVKILADYQRSGFFKGYSYDSLLQFYRERGIKTIQDHKGCNNHCQWGPHVVKGGHCMVPPVPGTKNYEEVLSGRFAPPPPKKNNKNNMVQR